MRVKFLYDHLQPPKFYNCSSSQIIKKLPLHLYVTGLGHVKEGNKAFTERVHDNTYQIIYTVSGSGIFKCNGKTFTLKQNQVILINCNDYHYYTTGPEGIWEYKWMHFRGSACQRYFSLINNPALNPITIIDDSEIDHCFNKAFKAIEDDVIDIDLIVHVLLVRILADIYTNRNSPYQSKNYTEHRTLIENALKYIKENFKNKLCIKDISQLCNLNEYYFSRLFKRYTGFPPYEYIIHFRIDKSKDLLKNTDLPVFEIAFKVGFENVNIFIRNFKKLVGTTPLKFRLYGII